MGGRVVLPFFGKKPSAGNAAPAERSEQDAPQPPHTELSSLDFSGGDAVRALAECAGQVEVQEAGSGLGAVFEEAAVLYANGDVGEAEKVLSAVLDEPANNAGEGLWMMLLDLYKLTGQRQRFDTRVVDYATRFERSPPPWEDLSSQAQRPPAEKVPLVNLGGSLSGQAASQFQQIETIGRKSGAIRIDLARLRTIDEAGCTLLRKTLDRLAADRVKVSLRNCRPLVDMLAGQVVPGRAQGRDIWLLLLEVLQHTGEQERFENLAVDYAITFEESPPSWESKAQQRAMMTTAGLEAAVTARTADDRFCLEGDVVGAANEAIRQLAAHAAPRQTVEVDCSRLRRLDFVSAGTLFNILATLQAQGKLVVLHNVNGMVAALLRVMGVDQVAQVTLRH